MKKLNNEKLKVLFLSSYPPRECGIATYSQDLIYALNNKFGTTFDISVCAMESGISNYPYGPEVSNVLDTSNARSFADMVEEINHNDQIRLVLVQHEFGFFKKQERAFVQFITHLNKPCIIVFHTVLPQPNLLLKANVQAIVGAADAVIVMTNNASQILKNDYDIADTEITVIAHGTHLATHLSQNNLKDKYDLSGKKVLTTFGLLSSGKNIETSLRAMPDIIKHAPDVVFLIIGKTHPEVVKSDGEQYRDHLESIVAELAIQDHVRFINSYLELPVLLEYLQLTDVYLFTTNDPNQAVSGTFVYAMSCGCPIVSTPIPHAKELLTEDTGIIIDFQNSQQLYEAVIKLFDNEPLRRHISNNALQKIVFTVWENSAIAHAKLIAKKIGKRTNLFYLLPAIKLDHLKEMTTNFGMIQFSKINYPDAASGYTIDDNARAMIAVCMHYKWSGDNDDLFYIEKYLNFIEHCQQPSGNFLNYVNIEKEFTKQNEEVNLDDANGRTVWALGFLISNKSILPEEINSKAIILLQKSLTHLNDIHSPRALAFIIKGLYFYDKALGSTANVLLIERFSNRLMQMYEHESTDNWEWFESYLTYANSLLPEAMLCAYLVTKNNRYKEIACESLDFLLSYIFNKNGIEVISNKSKFKKHGKAADFGEQPIDVAYTILTLSKFYDEFKDESYYHKMITAFNWFLGENRLKQIIYNPCTGGCYDGLEEHNVNLNQGAESTVSYLMARLTIEMYRN